MNGFGVLVCVSAVAGVMAACAAACAQEGGLLPNGGFEDAAGEQAAGWVFQPATGQASGRRRADGGIGGSACLEVVVTEGGQCDYRPASGAVSLEPGSAYLLTGAVKASNAAAGSHSLELQWFSGTGYISRDTVSAAVADRWVTLAIGPVVPPEGAASVYVLLRCYAPGTYGFDALRLERVPAPGRGQQVLRNGGFDSDADGDGQPDAWVAQPAAGDALAWDGEVRQSGGHSVRIRRPAGAEGLSPAWVQEGIAVTPALRYELSAATRADAFGREVRLAVEWLQAGQVLAAEELRDQTAEGWQRKSLRVLAPPAAEQARVLLQAVSGGTVWFDAAALLELRLAAQVELRVEEPNARGLIRDGVDPREVTVRYALESEEDAALRLALTDAAGAVLAETRPADRAGVWRLDLSGRPRGAYRVTAEALRAEGVVLASEVAPVDIVAPDAPGLFFRSDHVALVEGKPWFPIGVCSMPVLEPAAERLAAAGFNLIVTGPFTLEAPEKVRAVLDRARSLGLYLVEWNNGWAYDDIPFEERERRFQTSAANVAGHPAFLGWLCDEALWNGVPLAKVRNAYLAARAAMPTYAFWQNQAPRNTVADLARYVRWADVTGMDIYPVEGADHSDLPDKTLRVVGAEMDKQHRTTLPPELQSDGSAAGRKPVWAILQGFGWGAWEKDPKAHRRAPTWEETRFMAYDAILHGAVGIVYWGASYEAQDAPIWDSLRRMARELADITPALISPERVEATVEGAPGVLAQGRRVDGRLWVIAVNELPEAADARIRVPGAGAGFERVAEAGAAEAGDGVIRDRFAPYGVHVYRQR